MNQIKTRTERYAGGKYMVYCGLALIGHIIGGKSTWLAEQGPIDCGYHTTKAKAVDAIRAMYCSRMPA